MENILDARIPSLYILKCIPYTSLIAEVFSLYIIKLTFLMKSNRIKKTPTSTKTHEKIFEKNLYSTQPQKMTTKSQEKHAHKKVWHWDCCKQFHVDVISIEINHAKNRKTHMQKNTQLVDRYHNARITVDL